MDFTEVFKKENAKFLSRLFGIFSEKIPPIWCKTKNSPFECIEGRPTIYKENKRYTLDFVFKDKGTGAIYVVEQKCWIEYQDFRYFNLTLKNFKDFSSWGGAVEYLLALAKNPADKNYKVIINGKETEVKGAVLIWARASEDYKEIINEHPYLKIVSMEQMVTDLVKENNQEYMKLIETHKDICEEFFEKMKGV